MSVTRARTGTAERPARALGERGVSSRRQRPSRAGLHLQAAATLRKLIVRGDLAPGEALNEGALSEALGVSRTPVREALKLLEAEGLVELRPNRRARVAPLKRSEIRELFEAVSGIERLAAELAAVRITPGELRRLHVMQRRMERLHERGDLRGYFEVNQQIHGFVVECGGNRTLAATHDWLLARVERARFFALSARGRWDESVVEHRAILAALEGRDPAAAGRALSEHVQRTGAVVVEILRATHATPDPPP